MKIKLLILMLFIMVASLKLGAHPAFAVRSGLHYLKEGQLENAETELQKAVLAAPDNPVVKYNLGHVNYRKRKYEKAGLYFAEAAEKAENEDLKFRAFHNLGNAAYRGNNFALAVDAYKQGLELKEDEKTRYNLTQAEEKLKEQMEQEQQQKSDSEQQKDKENSQQGDDQQKQSGDQQQGDQQQNDSQGEQQSGDKGDKQQGQEDQHSGEKGEQGDEQQGQQEQQSEQQKDGDSKEGGQQQEGQEQRQDVEMAQSEEQKGQPEASQRARALKNRKLNPYMVEKILKELQERERQAQLYYRNDPQPRRQEQLDPFNMDAQQLNEFFRNRGRPQQQKKDEPDW